MWRHGLRALVVIVTLLFAGSLWIIFTEPGARLAVTYVSGMLPNFKARHAGGTLVGPLHLRTVVIRTTKLTIDADDIRVDWAPSCLLLAEACIRDARIGRLTLEFAPAAKPMTPAQRKKLPAIELPIDLDIAQLTIAEMDIVRGEKRTRYTGLALAGTWQDSDLRIDQLVIGMPGWQATAVGTLTTTGDWPLSATLDFALPRSGKPVFALAGKAAGSLTETSLSLESQGLVAAHVDGRLQPLAPGIPFSASLAAARFVIPPSGDPAKSAVVENIALQAHGEMLGELAIDGQASIDTPWTPPLPAALASTGTWRGLDKVSLRIDDPKLKAIINSDYRWLGGQHFAGTVDVRHLDLSLVNRALPSALAGTLRVDGNVVKEGTTIALAFTPIAGRLRTWPLATNGRMRWQDAQWHFDNLVLDIGANRATINGTLGSEWRATAALALGDLQVLQPSFAGNATGSARISGLPTEPAFGLRLDARDLLLPTIPLPIPDKAQPRLVRLPAADWRIEGTATLGDIVLTDAHTVPRAASTDPASAIDVPPAPPPFTMAATGTVNWKEKLLWDLDTRVDDLALHLLLPELGGRVSGPFATRGVLGETLEVLAVDTQLDGALDDAPLRIDAGFLREGERMRVDRLRLDHGANHLAASGRLDPARLSLVLDADAPSLADSFRALAGNVRINARADGPRATPDIDADAVVRNLIAGDILLGTLDGNVHIDDGAHSASSLVLSLRDISRSGQSAQSVDIRVDGTRSNHRIDIAADNRSLAGAATLTGALRAENGAWTGWDGALRAGNVSIDRWRWLLIGEPALAVSVADAAVSLAPHCWTDGAARACVTEPAVLGKSGNLAAEVFHLPVEPLLGGLLPIDTVVNGRIGATLEAAWKDAELTALDADLRNAEPLRLALAGDDVESQRDIGIIEALLLDATADPRGLHVDGELSGDNIGAITTRFDLAPLSPKHGARHLDGTLHIDRLRLALVEAFTFQLHDFAGTVDGNVSLHGTPERPQLAGTLGVHDGRVGFTRAPLVLSDININSRFGGDRVDIAGSFRTPESPGVASLAATAALRDGNWSGQGTLTADQLVIASQPEWQFTTAPRLKVEFDATRLSLSGDVGIPSGRIEMKALPKQSVARSRDVIVVDEERMIDGGGFVLQQYADVDVTLGNDIVFRAFGAKGSLTGNLRMLSTPQLPFRLFGELHVKEGEYTAFGQFLKLRNADIIFNGPSDQPLVDALAVREISDGAVHEVGLRLSGSLRAPQTTIFSNPSVPEEEALVWLTTGSGPVEGSSNLRGEAAQAAMSLGLAQGSALLTAAGREIGLQDVKLSTYGDGDDAEVQVGTNLNERVYVGYNRRVFTGEESVLLRLQMTRRLMLEALSGLESALDIFYTFEF